MVFKPRMIYTTYIAAMNEDGTKYPPAPGRFIRIHSETDLGQFQPPVDYKIDSSGIVQHRFLATGDPLVTVIRLRAELFDQNFKIQGSDDEQRAIRYLSPSNSYLQVTSSTETPRVGDFMLFRVNITQYVESVYYHITSAGKLIFTNILPMDGARQKTFDVGISREMAPSAHILVYYVRYDGEIVADSMNFHVNTSSVTNHVNITINRRKDFTGNTIEILAYASPQSYVAFAALGLVQTRLFPPGNHFSSVMVGEEKGHTRSSSITFRSTMNCIPSIVIRRPVSNILGIQVSIIHGNEYFFLLNHLVTMLVQHSIPPACNYSLMFVFKLFKVLVNDLVCINVRMVHVIPLF